MTELIRLIWADHDRLNSLKNALEALAARFDFHYQQFISNEFHPAANYFYGQLATAFPKGHQPITELESEIASITDQIDAKSASISALSGALLQLAKQCISLAFKGGVGNTPAGEDKGGISVRDVIWQGRNQAIHYEEPGKIDRHVEEMFTTLNDVRSDDKCWDPRSQNNFAFEIVCFLGWRTYEDFSNDLKSIRGRRE